MVTRIIFFITCLFVFGGPLNANASLLFSDTFNSENSGSGALNYNGLNFWTVSNGTVDLIGNGYFDFFPGNGMYLDLDGSTSDAALLTSTSAFNFTPGTYTLSFDLGGSTRGDNNTVDVSLGGLYNETFTLASGFPLTNYQRTFNVGAATSANLSFDHHGGDNFGIILDNVALDSRDTSVVPEPENGSKMISPGLK